MKGEPRREKAKKRVGTKVKDKIRPLRQKRRGVRAGYVREETIRVQRLLPREFSKLYQQEEVGAVADNGGPTEITVIKVSRDRCVMVRVNMPSFSRLPSCTVIFRNEKRRS